MLSQLAPMWEDVGGLVLLRSPVVWLDASNCRTVSSRASWSVSHISCVCSTGRALSRWTTRGGKDLETRAHATCSPAVSPSSLSGRMAILRRSLAPRLGGGVPRMSWPGDFGCTPRGSCNRTLLGRVLRRFFNSKCFLEGFLEATCKGFQ